MPGKLLPETLEEIIKPLPPKDKMAIREQALTEQWLEEKIQRCKNLMKRDMWVGLPWFIAYTAALFTMQFSNITIALGVLGLVYFSYTIFTTGSYGMNRKRLKVYENLLQKIK